LALGKTRHPCCAFFAGLLILAKLGFGGLEISPRWRLPADIALYGGLPGSIIWEFVKFMRIRKMQERKKNGR